MNTTIDISTLCEPQLFANTAEGRPITLPDELVLEILSHCDVPSLLAFGATCRNWRRFIVEGGPWAAAWPRHLAAYHARLSELHGRAGPGGSGEEGGDDEAKAEEWAAANGALMRTVLWSVRVPCGEARVQAFRALTKVLPRMYRNVYKGVAVAVLAATMEGVQEDDVRVRLAALDVFSSLALLAANDAALIDVESAGREAQMGALLMGAPLADAATYGAFIRLTLLPLLFDALLARPLAPSGYVVGEVKQAQAGGSEVTDPIVRALAQILVTFHPTMPSVVQDIFAFADTHMADASSWRAREAGVLVFGAITDAMGSGQKPAPLPTGHPLYPAVVSKAIAALATDPEPIVRDSAAWALTNIFISTAAQLTTSFSTSSIHTPLADFPELQDALVVAVVARINDADSLVASNCCGILINMSLSFCSPPALLSVTHSNLFAVLHTAVHDLVAISAALAAATRTPRTPRTPHAPASTSASAAHGVAFPLPPTDGDSDAADGDDDAPQPAYPDTLVYTPSAAMQALPTTVRELEQLAYTRVFDAAALASALFSLWYEVLESAQGNLMDPYYDPVEDAIEAPPEVVDSVASVARGLMGLLHLPAVPAIRMPADASPVSHRSRFAHVVGRIEFMTHVDDAGLCRFCGKEHAAPLADVRAFLLHALAPAVPLLFQDEAHHDLVLDLLALATDVVEEPDIGDAVHIAKAEASLVISFGISVLPSMPDIEAVVAPLCIRVVDALIGSDLMVQCYAVWQRCVQLIGSIAHHTADHLAPQFDDVVARVIRSAGAFLDYAADAAAAAACALLTAEQAGDAEANAIPSVSIGALCIADMIFIVEDHLDENGRLATVFDFMVRVLHSAPAPTARVDRSEEASCCAQHAAEAAARAERVAAAAAAQTAGPLGAFQPPFRSSITDAFSWFANVESFLFSARSLVHYAVPEHGPAPPAFAPYARTILEVVRDTAPFLCPTRSAPIMAEAAALVGQLAVSYPALAALATHDDIVDMVACLVMFNRDHDEDSVAADFAEDTFSLLSMLIEVRDAGIAPGAFHHGTHPLFD